MRKEKKYARYYYNHRYSCYCYFDCQCKKETLIGIRKIFAKEGM